MKIRSSYFKKEFDLSKAELIGQGNFAQVFRIFDNDLNDSLAIRKVKKTQADLEDITKQKIINEELRKVENQNILKIFDIIDTEQAVWYITEYCSGGSLWDVLNLCKDNKMNEKQCLEVVLQISKGVQQLHNHRITHRDLKPQNILLKTKYIQNKALPVVKLADFGLSTQKIIMQTIAGTKEYIAPEQAKFHNYTNAVDVWSLGIICDQILHGTPFYSGENNKQVFNKILKLPYRVRDDLIRVSIKNLLTSLLKKKPYQRPIIAVICKSVQKILEEIQVEILPLKNEKLKKKQSKDEGFQSYHSSNLSKYTSLIGMESRKGEPKKIDEVKPNPLQVRDTAKQTKSPQPGWTSTPKKQIYIPPTSLATSLVKNEKQQQKRQQPRRVPELKRQISGKKPQTPLISRSKQISSLKPKQTKDQQPNTDKEITSQKQNRQLIARKLFQDPQPQQIPQNSLELKTTTSITIRNIQNLQIPIYKLDKKKIVVPQPKKDVVKAQQMEVSTYIQRLVQSKRELQQVVSCIKVDKIPSFLPNTTFTSQQFTVSTSQTAQCISQLKNQYQILNFIQYNEEYDVKIYRKTVELQKKKKKSVEGLKKINEQLKAQFLKQVDNYVESYLDKILK